MGVYDSLRLEGRPGGVEDERRLVGSCVDTAERSLGGDHRCGFVEVENRRRVAEQARHPPQFGLAAPLGNDQRSPGVTNAERNVLRPQQLGAGNRDQSQAQRTEQDHVPLGGLAREYDHPVAAFETSIPQQTRPAGGTERDVMEGQMLDRTD